MCPSVLLSEFHHILRAGHWTEYWASKSLGNTWLGSSITLSCASVVLRRDRAGKESQMGKPQRKGPVAMGWPNNGAECVLRGLACRKDAWCVEPQQEFQKCCRLCRGGGVKQGVTPHIVLLVPPLPGLQVAEVSVEKRLGKKTSTLQLVHHQGQGPNSKAEQSGRSKRG